MEKFEKLKDLNSKKIKLKCSEVQRRIEVKYSYSIKCYMYPVDHGSPMLWRMCESWFIAQSFKYCVCEPFCMVPTTLGCILLALLEVQKWDMKILLQWQWLPYNLPVWYHFQCLFSTAWSSLTSESIHDYCIHRTLERIADWRQQEWSSEGSLCIVLIPSRYFHRSKQRRSYRS